MISKSLLFVLFVAVFVRVHTQTQYNTSYQTFSPFFENLNDIAVFGAGYVVGNNYIEPQSGFYNTIIPSNSCSGIINGSAQNLAVTLDANFYCLQSNQTITALNQVNPSNSEIIQSFPYDGFIANSLTVSDKYIILGGSALGLSNFSAYVFDTQTSSFFCKIPFISAGENNLFTMVAMMADALILASEYQLNPLNTSYHYVSCSTGDSIITSLNDKMNRQHIWAFNKSTTFITESSSQSGAGYLQILTFDLTGTARFGASINIGPYYTASKLNDTTFLLPSYNPNQEFVFDIDFIIVNPKLELILVRNDHTGLVMSPYFFGSVLIGTTNLIINDEITFFYDFHNKNITQVWTSAQPIILANNSVVNITEGGYFIQSPGEPIYFISAPIVGDAILSADYNDVWAFYTPEFILQYGFEYCILTRFQINTSTITRYGFEKCPINQLNFDGVLNLVAVYFEEGNPNPYVAYTCTFAYLVIVNQTNVVLEKVLNIDTPSTVNVNFTSNIATIFRNDPKTVQVYTIDIKSGKTVTTLNVSNSLYSGAFRMNDYYYMIGGSVNESYSYFNILDVNSLSFVTNLTLKNQFIRSNYFFCPYFVLGTDQNSSNFSAIVISSPENQVQLISQNGQITEVKVNNLIFYDQSLVSKNTFLAIYYDDVYFYNKYITIIN